MASPLVDVLSRAGAVMTSAGASGVPAHFGSPAGELGVCVHAVGIADRADLVTLQITGRPAPVAALLERVSGVRLEPGGVAAATGAWWCAGSAEEVTVLAERRSGARLASLLRAQSRRLAHVRVEDVSGTCLPIAIVGRHAMDVLLALGLVADPRDAPPFGPAAIDGVAVRMLLQGDHRVLLLVEPDRAHDVWCAVADAGRPFAMSCVGREAVERYALFDRVRMPL